MPTGQWTMNEPKAKRVVIANSDDKRQITAVFAATMTDEYLPVQLIYKGTTSRCHPKVVFPEAWDIFHSKNHWSNEVTMRKYIQNIIVPFVNNKQLLKLKKSHPALAIIDCFQGQTTSGILDLLQENNIITVIVPPNCTDKLQPIDLSISKPVKDQMRGKFQEWYASEVQKQLKSVPLDKVKVDLTAAVAKTNCARWIKSTIESIQKRPEVTINGFKESGILQAVNDVID